MPLGLVNQEQRSDWIVVLPRLDLIPRSQENDVAHQHLVLERRSITTLRLRQRLLHLPSNTGYRANMRPLKLGHLQRRREHVLDEGSILEDLVRDSSKL